jgi:hypothetical protein
MALLIMFIFQLLTYDNLIQSWIYPLFSLLLSGLLFFVPPAVVIDNSDTPSAIRRSVWMFSKNWHFVLVWAATSLALISIVKLFADLVFASPFSNYFVLLINCLFILPFLTILQTQMYMEKYPLAR